MIDFLKFGSVTIAADHRGSNGGVPVVFLHAGVADLRMWSVQLAALEADHEVVAYDRRGFGATTAIDEAFSHVEDLKLVLDHYGFDPVLLVGASQGGRIAIDFALRYPDRVVGLVLMAPAVSGESPDGFDHPAEVLALADRLEQAEEAEDLDLLNDLEAHAWLDGPMVEPGRVGGEVRELFLDMNAIALRAPELTMEVEPPAALQQVEHLQIPALIIWGDLDFPHVRDLCERLADQLPGSKTHVVPGTAHLPNMEQPALINSLLADFAGALAD